MLMASCLISLEIYVCCMRLCSKLMVNLVLYFFYLERLGMLLQMRCIISFSFWWQMFCIGQREVNISRKSTDSRLRILSLRRASKMKRRWDWFRSSLLSDWMRKCTLRQRMIMFQSRVRRQQVVVRTLEQSVIVRLQAQRVYGDCFSFACYCRKKLPQEYIILQIQVDQRVPISFLEARMFISQSKGSVVCQFLKTESAISLSRLSSLLSFMYYSVLAARSYFPQAGIPSKDLHRLMLRTDRSLWVLGLLALRKARQKRFKCLLNISINNNPLITISPLPSLSSLLLLPFPGRCLYSHFMAEVEGKVAEQYQDLLLRKAYYEQLLTKNQSLPIIIEQKRTIIDTLAHSNIQLTHKIAFRKEELAELQKRLEEFERLESLVSKLEEREREMESQYEDYQHLSSKLDREIKIMQEEAQILKGKAIIEYNRITEVREESATQTKRREILEKHHEQLKKGGEVLKRKVKNLKEEHKKRTSHRHKIEEVDLEREVKQLRSEQQYCKRQLEDLIKSQSSYVTQEEHRATVEELKAVRAANEGYKDEIKLNEKLKQQRSALQDRINYLSNIGIEFINQKKMSLVQLSQKCILYEKQRQSQEQNLAQKQQRLAQYIRRYPQALTQPKKVLKKRRQPKSKSLKKLRQSIDQPSQLQVVQKRSFFRCHKLKRIIFYLIVIFMVFGLVIDRYYAI